MKEKLNGKGAEECKAVDWTEFSKNMSGKSQKNKKDEYKWDVEDVDETWTVEFDEDGRRITASKTSSGASASDKGEDELGNSIVNTTMSELDSQEALKAAGAFVTGEIDAKAVSRAAKAKGQMSGAKPADNADISDEQLDALMADKTPSAEYSEYAQRADQMPEEASLRKQPAERAAGEKAAVKDAKQPAAKKTYGDRQEAPAAKETYGDGRKQSAPREVKREASEHNAAGKTQKGRQSEPVKSGRQSERKDAGKEPTAKKQAAGKNISGKDGKIDEKAIRKSVDDKIIIKSEELKKKRKPQPVSKDKKIREKTESTGKIRAQEEKYKNMGSIPSRRESESKFRRESAAWRYDNVAEAQTDDAAINEEIDNESFIERLKNASPVQYIAAAMAVVLIITGVMTTSVYAQYRGELNKYAAMANLPSYTAAIDTGMEAAEEVQNEDVYIEDAAAEPEEDSEHKVLSLVLSSVEKDLKIKLVDGDDTLVKGVPWGVKVTDSKGDESTYDDEDEDGIIHLTDVSAGDYSVALEPSEALSNYEIPTSAQEVSVKAKIEYKVIANIKDEIKKESEVDVAAEDPNGAQGADVDTGETLKDTVAWVESSETEEGEQYEEAQVDLSKTEKLYAFADRLLAAVKSMAEGTQSIFDRYSVAALIGNPVIQLADEDDLYFMEPEDSDEDEDDDDVEDDDEDGDDDDDVTIIVDDDDDDDDDDDIISDDDTIVTGVSISSTSLKLAVGASSKLTLTYTPSDAEPSEVEWISADSSVASISNGVVTGVKEGSTTVGATVNNMFVVTCEVTVSGTASESTLKITGSSAVDVGSTITLTAQTDPEDVTIKSWASDDISIASVDYSGKTATIKGISAGTAIISAEDSNGVKAVFKVTVSENDEEYADNAQLYDSNKNQLYVLDNGEYRLAKYIDYKSGNYTKFYKKAGEILYCGWQTIDGLTYYYTEDHEKVTGDQVIGGVVYHFGSDGALSQGSGTLGIDVSKYQPTINWESVKASGVNYVIIRCGYRGASTGSLIQDPLFTSHIKGAKAAGLKVGVYFFSTALNETEAVEEASMCAALCSGYGINYPVFLDVESSTRPGYNSLSAAQRTANIQAFCQTIQSAGYTPGIYANKTWLSSYINTSSLSCKIWLAQYNSEGPTYAGHYDIWQYTSKGSVEGVSGNVDMNQSYLGY